MRKTARFFAISGAIVLGNIGWLPPALADGRCYWHCDAPATIGPGFGNSVSSNNAKQIIDPNPPRATGPAPGTDGATAVAAYNRYRLGRVKRPEAVSTKTGGGTKQ